VVKVGPVPTARAGADRVVTGDRELRDRRDGPIELADQRGRETQRRDVETVAGPDVLDVIPHVAIADVDDYVRPRRQHITEGVARVFFVIVARQDIRLKAAERLPRRILPGAREGEEQAVFVADGMI